MLAVIKVDHPGIPGARLDRPRDEHQRYRQVSGRYRIHGPQAPNQYLGKTRYPLHVAAGGLCHDACQYGARAPTPLLPPDTLSKREKDVLEKLSLGLTAKEIGRNLSISPRTVSKHLENIRAKTGLQTLAALMTISRQLRIPMASENPDTQSE
ncbi:helix-turn-helix transcriptional regulator [Cupriavidus campinensis]|uniref:Helix-turn-helix transcriptional regulator n=1 Tax=Cupriavidus campinensis TaxID=151783 RepID=A0AAE9I4B5_9BURK|nr:helix-turn-helix transcriptional regulator [Cupriavidus campinensis]URF06383.1 helix-turn-helix transcriptional regulator [Cupriavidus campinensis]